MAQSLGGGPRLAAEGRQLIRLSIRSHEAISDKDLAELLDRARRVGLRGYFIVELGAVEARLEGEFGDVNGLLERWRELAGGPGAESLSLSYSRARADLPPVRCVRDEKELAGLRLELQALEAAKEADDAGTTGERTFTVSPDLGRLRDLEGFAVDEDPSDLPGLEQVLLKNIEPLAKALGVDRGVLEELAGELKGLAPERIHSAVIEKLQDSTKLDLKEFLRVRDDVRVELRHERLRTTGPETDSDPLFSLLLQTPVSQTVPTAAAPPLATSVTLPPQVLTPAPAEHGSAWSVAVAAMRLTALDGMEPTLALALAGRGITIRDFATSTTADLRSLVRTTIRDTQLELAASRTQLPQLDAWRAQARLLWPVVQLVDVLGAWVRIHCRYRVRFPWEAITQARPLPSTATVTLVVSASDNGTPPPTPEIDLTSGVGAEAAAQAPNVQVSVQASDPELADRAGAVASGSASMSVSVSLGEDGTATIATASPGPDGRVSFFVPVTTLRAFGANARLSLQVNFSGTVDDRTVTIRVTTEPVSPTDIRVDPEHGYPEITWDDCDGVIVFSPLDPDLCESLNQNVPGPWPDWAENRFNLFGTLVPPSEIPGFVPGGIVTYNQERQLIALLLADLEVGGALLTSLHDDLQPIYASCGKSNVFDNSNDTPGQEGHLRSVGVVTAAPNFNWELNPTLSVRVRDWVRETTIDGDDLDHPFLDLGNSFRILTLQDGPEDGIFRRINLFRSRLRSGRADISTLMAAGTTGVPNSLDTTYLPHYLIVLVDETSCNIWGCDTERVFDPTRPGWELNSMSNECDRVLPLLDEISLTTNYQYLRQRILTALDRLHRGHEALGREQFQAAFADYAAAESIVSGVLSDIENVLIPSALPPGGYHVHRLMTVIDAFEPTNDLSEVYGRPELLALLAIFSGGDEKIVAALEAMTRTEVVPILDGDFSGRPLEDAFYYLRDFVIPTCRGELYLRRAEHNTRLDYDRAIQEFERAALYIPEDAGDNAASSFLWLRIARAYLRKGYKEYAHGSSAIAYSILGHVLAATYGPGDRVKVSLDRFIDGERRVNPLVLALKLEACQHRSNIDAGLNPLGFPERYIPLLRWNWLADRADQAATLLDEVEQLFIRFRVNAEDASFVRLNPLSGAVTLAKTELAVSGLQRQRGLDEVDAALLGRGATQNRLQNAEDALTQFQRHTAVRFSFNQFANAASVILGGQPGVGMSLVNTTSNDLFQLSQLQRQVSELRDAVDITDQQVVIAERGAAIAQIFERLSQLKLQIAQDALAFEQNREFNYARWFALADEVQDIVRYRLRSALTLLYLAQRALYHISSVEVPVIAFDRDPTDVAGSLVGNLGHIDHSLLMGQHIRDGLTQLRNAWDTFFNTLDDYQGREQGAGASITETILFDRGSVIYTVDPLQFAVFRQSGGPIDFEIRLDSARLPPRGLLSPFGRGRGIVRSRRQPGFAGGNQCGTPQFPLCGGAHPRSPGSGASGCAYGRLGRLQLVSWTRL